VTLPEHIVISKKKEEERKRANGMKINRIKMKGKRGRE
jgi:hypothetical protein